jgi:hypothetical protein
LLSTVIRIFLVSPASPIPPFCSVCLDLLACLPKLSRPPHRTVPPQSLPCHQEATRTRTLLNDLSSRPLLHLTTNLQFLWEVIRLPCNLEDKLGKRWKNTRRGMEARVSPDLVRHLGSCSGWYARSAISCMRDLRASLRSVKTFS